MMNNKIITNTLTDTYPPYLYEVLYRALDNETYKYLSPFLFSKLSREMDDVTNHIRFELQFAIKEMLDE